MTESILERVKHYNVIVQKKMKQNKHNFLVRRLLGFASVAVATLGFGAVVSAGDITWDFSGDPADEGIVLSGNNDEIWVEEGGNDGGFLAVTYPEGGQSGFVAFPSIDADNEVVTAFKLEGDVRIGNSTGERAADGFSISLARDNGTDPVVDDLNANDSISGQGSFAGGIAEGGTTTGVAVSFDTWSGNVLPDSGDIEGIIVRVDNVTVTRVGLPTRHGECDDITSLQTGPRNQLYWDDGGEPRDPESWSELCWQPFSVELDETAKLTVMFKGNAVLDGFQTTYFPTKSRLILAGRTGGANEHTHFDNLHLVTQTSTGGGAPPAPENLKIDLEGAGFVRLSWDAAPTADRVAYKIERDGVQLAGQVTDTTFDDFGVNANSSYAYKVYSMSIDGTLSEAGTAEVTASTIGEVPVESFLKLQIFGDSAGTVAEDFIFGDPNFPDSPSGAEYINGLDFTPGGIADNYGGLVTGTLTPEVSGDYHFFVRSDDGSEFFLNEDGADIPDPSVDFSIAFEVGCCNAFFEPGDGDQTTVVPISLTAGESYGFAMVVKEGGGGDWFQVAWRMEGDDTPAADLAPITGSVIGGGMGDPTGAWINITAQPQGGIVPEGSDATVSFSVDAGSPYTPAVLYQWMKDGVPVAGATSADLNLIGATAADSGDYTCKITVLGLTETTEAASVSVQQPVALAAGNTIAINFGADEPDGARSDVEGAAGVLGTSVWNNVDGGSGSGNFLTADVDGTAGLTGVSVTWSSPNTWSSRGRGEENNTGTGEDADLMTGYIDTNGTDPNNVTVNGLPEDMAYDVIVYMKGGVIGRGGDYTLQGGIADGLVALWNFDNEDFTDSVGIYNGEERGADPIGFTGGPSADFGQALTLDGIDQFVEITSGTPDDLAFADGSMSLSTWFRVGAFDKSWQALVAKGEGSNWRFARRGGENGLAIAAGSGDTPSATGAGADVNDGEWHHLVGVANQTFGTMIYIDGELASSNTGQESVLTANGSPMMIGDNPGAVGRSWNGDIDDVALWSRALSASEVSALAAGPLSTEGTTIPHLDEAPFNGTFVEGSAGDYIVFRGVTGGSFVLSGLPTNVRAPINGIEILIGGGFEAPVGGGGITSVALQDGQVVIEFEGTLQSADSVTGPYNAVAGATSPYSVAPTKASEFYIAD
jgi:hypothetical protein